MTKMRKFLWFKLNVCLCFGMMGLKILTPLFINSKQIFKYVLYLKRSSRKTTKTKRNYWLQAFPNMPLTKKANGLRMGKGKGKRILWYTIVTSGTILIELKNARFGRMLWYLKHFSFFLNAKLKIEIRNKPTNTICFPTLTQPDSYMWI